MTMWTSSLFCQLLASFVSVFWLDVTCWNLRDEAWRQRHGAALAY
jgi:hypothetical protein